MCIFFKRLLAIVLLASCAISYAGDIVELPATGPQPTILDHRGEPRVLYEESHALLISSSMYEGTEKGGWNRLNRTHEEMTEVANELQKHGFHVIHMKDPKSREIYDAFRTFQAKYGHKKNNRILMFFSGHGYTNPNNGFGYIVPVDAKNPDLFPDDFYEKAVPITMLDNLAREMTVRHALFLFDSCFSGSIFGTKTTLPPPIIGIDAVSRSRFFTGQAFEPIRQFMTAGSAGEILPNESIFIPLFIKALKYGIGAQNDGYVTGQEIGQWIKQVLPSINKNNLPQSPQSEPILDPRLRNGDMVFSISTRSDIPKVPNAKAQRQNELPNTISQNVERLHQQDSETVGMIPTEKTQVISPQQSNRKVPQEAIVSTEWMPLEKLPFTEINLFRPANISFPSVVHPPFPCFQNQLTPDGKILIGKIRDGIGFFDTASGSLLKSFTIADFNSVTRHPCEISGDSKLYASGTKFLLVTNSYKNAKGVFKEAEYWAIDMSGLALVQLKTPSNERLKYVFADAIKDEIVTFSYLPEAFSKKRRKNVHQYAVGDIFVRFIQANGTIKREKSFESAEQNRLEVKSFAEALEDMSFRLSTINSNMLDSYIFTNDQYFSLDDLVIRNRFRMVGYKSIGCDKSPSGIVVKTKTGAVVLDKNSTSGSICVIDTRDQISGRAYTIPEFGDNGFSRIVNVYDENILVISKEIHKKYSTVAFKYDLSTGLASSGTSSAIHGIIDKTGQSGVTWYRSKDSPKDSNLYDGNLYFVKFSNAFY
jgi:hypothetical protein